MKRSKIAAGVLALALGFGAAAPVHAADLDSDYVKDLMERMQNQIDKHEKEAETFDRLLNKAQEVQIKANEGQGAGTVEDDTTDKSETGNEETDSSSSQSSTGEKDTTTTEDESDDGSLDLSPAKNPGSQLAPSGGEGSTGKAEQPKKEDKDKDQTSEGDNKDDDKKNKADDEEIAKGPYDTKEEAIDAAKKALKAAPKMNEYVVYKDAADKFFFYLKDDTADDEGKVEEDGNEVVATGKKDDSKESSSPARKADSNAQTGVAGLVSVASILGAASVAYVASKKRD